MAGKGKPENLKPFKKGQTGNPHGRPPLSLEAKRLINLTRDEYAKLTTRFLFMNEEELNTIVNNKDAANLDRWVAKLIARGMEDRDHMILNAILNRVIGKEVEPPKDVNVFVQQLQAMPTREVIELGKEAIKFLEAEYE